MKSNGKFTKNSRTKTSKTKVTKPTNPDLYATVEPNIQYLGGTNKYRARKTINGKFYSKRFSSISACRTYLKELTNKYSS